MKSRSPGCNRKFGAVLAASAMLGLAVTHVVAASETRGYVVSWFHFAPYNTDADCPNGVNPQADQIFLRVLHDLGKTPAEINKIMDDDWVNNMNRMAGQRGKIDGKIVNVYVNPTSVPDPHLKTGQGHVGLGFNLDGKETADNYVDPLTGERGVDNEFFRVVACTSTQQGTLKARPTHSSIVWDALRDQMNAWLVEISGIDDAQNDSDVEVTVSRAMEPITRNAEGVPQQDMTFRVDPNPRAFNRVHARIKDGLLVTDRFDFRMIGDPYVMPEYYGRDARLRLRMSGEDSGKGILGAYFPWKNLYQAWALGGAVNESNLSMDLPGLYYALRRMADGYPDPQTGANTAISTSYVVELVPAYIKHVDEQSLVAAAALLPKVQAGMPSNPPGVIFKTVRIGATGDAAAPPQSVLVFADAKGMALYAREPAAAKRSCGADCAQTWVPFAAPEGAKPVGDWKIARIHGVKQWTLRGQPLYTYAKDSTAPPIGMAAAYGLGMNSANGHGVDGAWRVQPVVDSASLHMPREIAVSEVLGAPGVALVSARGMSLYTFDRKAGKHDSPLSNAWQPVLAPAAALPVGEFTIVAREHGDKQWAYKGKPLYTFEGDRELNDANGRGADDRMQAAVVWQYFTPAEVAMRKNERRGGILVSAASGYTLYGRDRISHNHTGGHNARGSTRGNPGIGTAIGLAGCDAQCEREWRPLVAPADAQPNGYWSVFQRPDGSRQWAYQGYALYTNGNDRPGLMLEHDSYTVVVNDDIRNLAPDSFGLGLYWRAVSP